FPEASKLDFVDKPRWSYTNGLVLSAAIRVYEATKNEKIYDYIYAYANDMIDSVGTIKTYKFENHNLDMIKSGDVLLYLYPKTKEDQFVISIETLDYQMETQPKTSDVGYGHKRIYPHQMWLDGLYMADPFHIVYAHNYIKDEAKKQKIYNDIVLQF